MTAPFRTLGLDHLVLRVTDMERMRAFYCEVLGGREERRLDALGLVQLRLGRSLLDLVTKDGKLGGGGPVEHKHGNLQHFCLRIEPFDPPALKQHLQQQGIAWQEPADRYGADGHGPSLYFEDPEGNQVELKGSPLRRVP